jgi:predicted permease
LWSKPKVCLDFYAEESIAVPLSNQNHNSVITWELLVIIVTFLLAVNMALIFVYRRCAKKELEKDVGFQVSAAVT